MVFSSAVLEVSVLIGIDCTELFDGKQCFIFGFMPVFIKGRSQYALIPDALFQFNQLGHR